MYAPLLYPLLGFIAGILAAMAGASLWLALALGLVACLVWFILRRFSKNPVTAFKINGAHNVWIFLAFVSAGIIDADFSKPDSVENASDIVAVTGNVMSIKNATGGDVAEVRVVSLIDKDGRVLSTPNMKILVRSDILDCDVDDRILVTSPLSEIGESNNWFEQSYVDYLHNKGFGYEIRCTDESVKVTGHDRTLSGIANSLRVELESFIEHTHLGKSTQNFLITVLLGDRAYLDNNRRNLFADAGISHILALSGMHVAIIAGIIMWFLFPINFAGLYRWRISIATLLLIFYAFLTGLAPSIVRATLMSVAVLVSLLMERKNSAWNSLLLATFIILVFSPYALLDVGLQLSFLCVASLIFFVRPLNPLDRRSHPRLYPVCSFFLTTIVATLGTWCVTARYFGKIPLMFLPANILGLPLLPFYITVAIIYLGLTAIGLEPLWLGHILDKILGLQQSALSLLTSDGATVIEFTPSSTSVFLWCMIMVLAALIIYGQKTNWLKYSFVAVSLLFAGSIFADSLETEPEAFIIQQSYRDLNILSRTGNGEKQLAFPRRSISKCNLANKDILILDQNVDNITDNNNLTNCDYLLLASGCKDEIDTIASRFKPVTIVIHPSIRKTKEQRIIHIADSLNLPCHSIRLHGPLKVTEN